MKRRRKPPLPLEKVVQSQIIAYLELWEPLYLIVERSNAGQSFDAAGRRITLGKAGTSDLKVYLRDGRTIHMEVKRSKAGKLNDNQIAMRETLTGLGHTYVVVWSVECIQTLLHDWGISWSGALPAAARKKSRPESVGRAVGDAPAEKPNTYRLHQ
jgi:hypothetical protein